MCTTPSHPPWPGGRCTSWTGNELVTRRFELGERTAVSGRAAFVSRARRYFASHLVALVCVSQLSAPLLSGRTRPLSAEPGGRSRPPGIYAPGRARGLRWETSKPRSSRGARVRRVRVQRLCTRVRKVCILGDEPVTRALSGRRTNGMTGWFRRSFREETQVMSRIKQVLVVFAAITMIGALAVVNLSASGASTKAAVKQAATKSSPGQPVDHEAPVQGWVHLRRCAERCRLDPRPGRRPPRRAEVLRRARRDDVQRRRTRGSAVRTGHHPAG